MIIRNGKVVLKNSVEQKDILIANGKIAKILDDNKMYYIAELPKENSDRCFGLVTDKKQLVVFEYGEGGKDTELVIWKRI